MKSSPANSRIGARAFWSLLHRFSLRYWKRHWLKLALLVGIVGLGTGSFLAIGLANRAATRSFDQFAQTVSGRSQVVLTASLGALSLEDLRAIRRALLDSEAALAPQLVRNARLADLTESRYEDSVVTLIGMDLLAASNFLIRYGAKSGFLAPEDEEETSRAPRVFTQESVASEYGWAPDDQIPLYLEDKRIDLRWAGTIPQLDESYESAARVLIIDWQDLASALRSPLQADRVDLIWAGETPEEETIAEAVGSLQQANPGHWIIESQAQRQESGATMTLALRMNLRALSALSLIVAICLVFQAMDSAVARRQGEIATLHSLGVSTRLTRRLWLADAAFIGLLGGTAGLCFGWIMAHASTRLVTQTVNTLYFRASEESLSFSLGEAATALGLTLGFCLIAGWWPARQAARSPLVETMRQSGRRSSYSRLAYLIAAAVLAFLAWRAYLLPPLPAENGHSIPVGGYALALFCIGIAVCLASLSLEGLGALTRPLGRSHATLRMALSQFRKPVTRHRLALSGVTLSVGMTAAMVILIGSFESTVRAWIGNTLQADLFVRSKAVSSMHDSADLSIELYRELEHDARVSDIGSIRSQSVRIQNAPTQLIGFDTDYLHRIDHTTWIDEPENLLDLARGDRAIVNEAFASRFDASVGSVIELPSATKSTSVTVIGIYADYGNENGAIGIDQQPYEELTGQRAPRGIALHVGQPQEIEPLAAELRQRYPAIEVMSNRWLREETLRIFNRVFSITYALQAIGLLISVVGLGSMLASLLIERRGETGALLRIGVSPRQGALATLWEGLGLATLGVASGLSLGAALGLVLVFIINKQSFGWTLALHFPIGSLASLAGLTLAGAACVSYFVGRWSANRPLTNEE
ncbi:FtsX-like permease family protein [Pelagicoccus sp. SDUM812003]|uniref:FtsX-like permease family protein n=1 Tax=Pelagicoccus sp. SDUM812003 TaxID=3041267 RepID=UPI0028100B31|nr:FtsX-like permease family protein [Pelagicoccus sp. SDUM812003]MDQ8202476.1 ABC transporter permease [Pelagicoccus sp. SDUM812003]